MQTNILKSITMMSLNFPNIFEVYLLTSSSKVDYIINIIKDNPKPNLHYTSKIISFFIKI